VGSGRLDRRSVLVHRLHLLRQPRRHHRPDPDQHLRRDRPRVGSGVHRHAGPIYPGKRYEDWDLPDPADLDLAAVRPIRDDIARRVRQLLADLVDTPQNP
jgi:hypothetical protein